MPPAHIGHGRLNLQNEEEALEAEHAYPSITIIGLHVGKKKSESGV
jgi:hypothetical protein